MTTLGKRRKGHALVTDAAATSNANGRAIGWRVQQRDHEAFHTLTEHQELSASELARDIVDEATRAVASGALVGDEYSFLSARFTHEQIEQISQAAGRVELEPTVWLRLMTTGAGEALLEQLQRALAVRRRR